ncbi:hypothetical protein LTR08_008992 [Meristemomyces frigidus]|nr:hypothetical protein LTR08_008992 [Meristemomyces frigidus]
MFTITHTEFRDLIAQEGTLVIDGALATELEHRGHDLNHPLWSAKILREHPEAIQQVHLDYYLAGADIATTASYQASTQGLHDHFGLDEDEANELMKNSVRLANRARAEAYLQVRPGGVQRARTLLVAGSVGPYGAYLSDGSEYRGDYQRTAEEFKDFHRGRLHALMMAQVDLLAIETMPSLPEIEAVCDLLVSEFPTMLAWVSCTLRDAKHLSDGTPMEDVLALVSRYKQIVALGVNCVPVQLVEPALQHLTSAAQILGEGGNKPVLLCYPNSGETWDAGSKTWSGPKPYGHDLANQSRKWTRAGTRLVGGCCRTGPKDIEAISKALKGR